MLLCFVLLFLCCEGLVVSARHGDTSKQLRNLRKLLPTHNIAAYIIPTSDDHMGSGMQKCDARLEFMSNFNAPGNAVITETFAGLWTSSKYYDAAEDLLDDNWTLMMPEEGDETMFEWMNAYVGAGSNVGLDPQLMSVSNWQQWESQHFSDGVKLLAVDENLVDAVWDERPPCIGNTIFVHDLKFTGRKWEDKIDDVRAAMSEEGVDSLIITSMDQIAWLFNLRGSDFETWPVFRSFAIIDTSDVYLFIPKELVTDELQKHLGDTENCQQKYCARVVDYPEFEETVLTLRDSWSRTLVPCPWAYSKGSTYSIYHKISADKRVYTKSPVIRLEAVKNEVEQEGMREAHIRDAAALISWMLHLEKQVSAGEYVDEITAAAALDASRSRQEHYYSLSFNTISAFGANSANIHYWPSEETNLPVDASNIYMVDSGAQYRDATTDITRTFHLGEPTEEHREMYTRVLMGMIDLVSLVIPEGTMDTRIDLVARKAIYAAGKDYHHGTSHGVGSFLTLHESPILVAIGGHQEHPILEGMVISDEPGYYEEGNYGIRHETQIMAVLKNNTEYGKFLKFEALSVVPFEPKLIKYNLLSDDQILWLSEYNAQIRDTVGPFLLKRLEMEEYEWMMNRTEPGIYE